MATHILTHADSLYWGNAQKAKVNNSKRGLPMNPIVKVDLGTPGTADADGHCASQSITAGTAALLNGALAGTADATYGRNVVAAWTNTAIITVVGTDYLGATMSEVSGSGTSFTGKKAFKTVTSVNVSANVTGCTVGTGDVLGLPYRCDAKYDILTQWANTTMELASSTFVAADTTDPATTSTGDVRGTIDPNTACNGSVRFVAWYKIADVSTNKGAYGVTQA